jgi:UDP-3-O-[3-hydroxymyristoyl] glucosamine N-acyltransferase
MTKPLYLQAPVGLTVGEIAALTGAELRNGACLDHVITNIAPLDRAGPSDLAFLDTAKYAAALTSTQAGACLTTERFERQAPSGLNVLRAQEPYRAFVDVARKLYPNALRQSAADQGVPAACFQHASTPRLCNPSRDGSGLDAVGR